MRPIPFNIPFICGEEEKFLLEAIRGGFFVSRCEQWLQTFCEANRVMLTPSCTHALEMAALLCGLGPGDEVIMPSFTFVSTANAFALRGARLCFVDVDPTTMNMAPDCVEAAINPKTKAIVAMHYGGVACDMAALKSLSERHNLYLIEDAAHCIDARIEGRHLGTLGHLGTLSFHQTKNIHCGEGGALLVNDPELEERASVILEKGTNRAAFSRGKTAFYEWVDLGSSYQMNEVTAAFLWAQIQHISEVSAERLVLWNRYQTLLEPILEKKGIKFALIPSFARQNAHVFYLKCQSGEERDRLSQFLKEQSIVAHFHYLPLHLSPAGKRFGYFSGEDRYTLTGSRRLLRLPLYAGLSERDQMRVIEAVAGFYTM